jgi:uncharacterized protein (TIGR03067 family)
MHHRMIYALPLVFAVAGPAWAEQPVPPQVKVLERYLGTWDHSTTIKPAASRPIKSTGFYSAAWTLDGRFVQMQGEDRTQQSKELQLATYDPQEHAYRRWFFNSMGVADEMSGQWDAETQSFTWTGSDGDHTSVQKDRFSSADAYTYEIVVTDKQGKLVLEVEGRMVRRKAASVRPTNTLAEDQKRLQGPWRVVRGERAGQALPATVKVEAVVAGDRFRLKFQIGEQNETEESTFKLQDAQPHRRIRLASERKSGEPAILQGIYRFTGDRLEICVRPGADPPSEFVSKPGTADILYVMERAEEGGSQNDE